MNSSALEPRYFGLEITTLQISYTLRLEPNSMCMCTIYHRRLDCTTVDCSKTAVTCCRLETTITQHLLSYAPRCRKFLATPPFLLMSINGRNYSFHWQRLNISLIYWYPVDICGDKPLLPFNIMGNFIL